MKLTVFTPLTNVLYPPLLSPSASSCPKFPPPQSKAMGLNLYGYTVRQQVALGTIANVCPTLHDNFANTIEHRHWQESQWRCIVSRTTRTT
jgi:hypothetical protein